MKNLEDLDNEIYEMDLEPASKKFTDYINILRTNIFITATTKIIITRTFTILSIQYLFEFFYCFLPICRWKILNKVQLLF